MPKAHTTTVDILRHGQTTADDILRGRIDVPLSDNGYQQMRDRLTPYMQEAFPWQHIVTSPLQRCAKFADDLAQQHDATLNIDERFIEMDFGDWDGRHFDELRAENPDLFIKVWREPHNYCPPGGESFIDFCERINNAWQLLIEQHQGQHVLLICHGGVIRALLAGVMQMPMTSLSRLMVPYACLSRVSVHHQQDEEHWPQLIFHNP